MAFIVLVLFTPVRVAFGLAQLSWKLYLIGLGLALIPLVIMEISKAIEHAYAKSKSAKN